MGIESPKINRPEDSDKNGDFWEKKYDDGNNVEKTIIFCPQCGGQVVASSEPIEKGEYSCSSCGFEGGIGFQKQKEQPAEEETDQEPSATEGEEGEEAPEHEEAAIGFLMQRWAKEKGIQNPSEADIEEFHADLEEAREKYSDIFEDSLEMLYRVEKVRKQIGEESWNIYQKVKVEYTKKILEDAKKAVLPFMEYFEEEAEKIDDEKDLEALEKEFKETMLASMEEIADKYGEEFFSDERVLKAFEGNEEAFQEMKEFDSDVVGLIDKFLDAGVDEDLVLENLLEGSLQEG